MSASDYADRACCACGEPLKLENGLLNLAEFEVDPVPNVTRSITAYVCRKCARRITAAWSRKMKRRALPRPVRPGERF